MSLQRNVRTEPGAEVIRTSAPFSCGPGCGLLAHVKDGKLIKVEPGDHPGTSHICPKCLSSVKRVYHLDRIKYPMKRTGQRGEGKWERISWDEALATIATRFEEIADEYGPASVSFIMDFMALLATDVVMGFTGACGGTFITTQGYGDSGGTSNDQVCLGSTWWYGEDYTTRFDNPGLVLSWGGNPIYTDFFRWNRIREVKEKGARIVSIDPIYSSTAAKSDEYVQIRPGTDGAMALGMMYVILEHNLEDRVFITEHTVGPFLVRNDNGMFLREKDVAGGESENYLVWDTESNTPRAVDMPGGAPALTGEYEVAGTVCKPAFQLLSELIRQFPPERASALSEVPAETITRLAIEYATQKPAASFRGMGSQRTFHGDLVYHAINTLAAVTGNISFEGHTPFEMNHLGFITHGVPNLMPVMLMYDSVIKGEPYPIRSLWITRHNLVNSIPNFNRVVGELLPKLEFIVVVDPYISPTAKYADIVLPACTIFECDDIFYPIGNGSHNYLQLQQKVIEPLHESKSDVEIIKLLAGRMGYENYLPGTDEELIDLLLASGHPSMEGITVKSLKENGPTLPSDYEMPHFLTPSGRLEFYLEVLKSYEQELPYFEEPLEGQRQPLAQRYPLSLITPHPKLRTHYMFSDIDWIRQKDPEPMLEMNRADSEPRGIKDGDIVRIYNDRGEVTVKVKTNQGIRATSVKLEEGWPPDEYIGGTHQSLTHETLNRAQQVTFEPNFSCYDVLVEVELVKEA